MTTEFEYVGFWPRAGALLVDGVLTALLTFPILTSIYGPSYWEQAPLLAGPLDFVVGWFLPGLLTVLFWMACQATPGKLVIGARIVDARTGRTPSVRSLVFRYLAYVVSALPLGLGFFVVAFDPRRQCWHDKVAHTVVVRRKHRGPIPVVFPNGESGPVVTNPRV